MSKVNGLERILLVDDDLAVNFIHKKVVEKASIQSEVKICSTVREGIEFLSSFNGHDHPFSGLVFLDVQMPDYDGWDFLEQFRSLTIDKKENIRIVMLTTGLSPEVEAKVKNFPEVAAIYSKPLTVDIINEVVSGHFV